MSRPGFVSLALLLAGCGDGLVDGTWPGEALYTLSGLVVYDGTDLPDAPLYVTIVWERGSDDGYSWLPPLQVETVFPARYTLDVYAPPPPDLVSMDGETALGVPLLYADHDGDGVILPDVDELVGGSGEVLLVYVFEGSTPQGEGGPPSITELLDPGFHAVVFEGGGCPGDGPPVEVDPLDVELTVGDAGAAGLRGCGPG